jgi:hypothetical protein
MNLNTQSYADFKANLKGGKRLKLYAAPDQF